MRYRKGNRAEKKTIVRRNTLPFSPLMNIKTITRHDSALPEAKHPN